MLSLTTTTCKCEWSGVCLPRQTRQEDDFDYILGDYRAGLQQTPLVSQNTRAWCTLHEQVLIPWTLL